MIGGGREDRPLLETEQGSPLPCFVSLQSSPTHVYAFIPALAPRVVPSCHLCPDSFFNPYSHNRVLCRSVAASLALTASGAAVGVGVGVGTGRRGCPRLTQGGRGCTGGDGHAGSSADLGCVGFAPLLGYLSCPYGFAVPCLFISRILSHRRAG